MTLVILLMVLLPSMLAGSAAHAQTALTLEQVLALAEQRSEAVAAARAAGRRAEGDRIRARSTLYPQLSASASYDRALASEFEGLFEDGVFGEGDRRGPGLEKLPFGRENTWRVSLSLTQNLYSGGRIGAAAAAAAAGRETARASLETARGQVLFEALQAYYDALLADRLVAIAESTLEQASATLRRVQVGFEAGAQPEFEVLRARVARDAQLPAVIRARANREIALLRLRRLLDLPANAGLRLADTLGDPALPPPAPFAERLAAIERAIAPASLQNYLDVPDRWAVAEAEAAVRLREASLAAVEAQRRPAVSVNVTYSRVAYPSGVLPAFDRTNWSIGASLSVPILTGGRQRGDELVAQAELDQARAQLEQTEELAALEWQSALAELVAARAAWEATAGSVEQASRAYAIAEVRYGAGVSTQLELSDARLQLQQAEANRAQAARDLQVARARVALLPSLPIGGGPAAPRPAVPTPVVPVAPAAPSMPAGQFTRASSLAPQPAMAQPGTR
jgi:outer membrane protein